MIKVITEFNAKEGVRILPQLRQLRLAAMNYSGYVSGETFVSTRDVNKLVIISTWQSIGEWTAWEESEPRNAIYQQIEPLLFKKPMGDTYRYLSYQQAIKGQQID